MFHLDDIQRTWQVELPPPEATERVADLLRAYGARVTLQDEDFVAAEFADPPIRRAALATATLFVPGGAALLPLALRSHTDVVTAESLRFGRGSRMTVTSTGRRAHVVASDLGHGLDRDRRPLAVP